MAAPRKAEKREQRPRHRLGGGITGEKQIVAQQARCDHLALQQRQHHMAAAEHQGTGAIKTIGQQQRQAGPEPGQQWQARQQQGKQRQGQIARALTDGDRQPVLAVVESRLEQARADHPCQQHHADLAKGGRPEQHTDRRDKRDQHAQRPAAQGTGHAPQGLGHHRHRDDLQAMHQPAGQPCAATAQAHGQGNQDQRRRQGKAQPGAKRAGQPRPRPAQGKAHLAAGRPREELAQGDQFGIGRLAQPGAALDEFGAEIPQVRHRPAEGTQAQPQEHQEHRPGTVTAGHGGIQGR